jgi:hypothetical protein
VAASSLRERPSTGRLPGRSACPGCDAHSGKYQTLPATPPFLTLWAETVFAGCEPVPASDCEFKTAARTAEIARCRSRGNSDGFGEAREVQDLVVHSDPDTTCGHVPGQFAEFHERWEPALWGRTHGGVQTGGTARDTDCVAWLSGAVARPFAVDAAGGSPITLPRAVALTGVRCTRIGRHREADRPLVAQRLYQSIERSSNLAPTTSTRWRRWLVAGQQRISPCHGGSQTYSWQSQPEEIERIQRGE